MARLFSLDRGEKQLITTIVSQYWNDRIGFSIHPFMTENERLAIFLDTVIRQNRYHDLHHGNVMLDADKNYRLIDVEGFQNDYPLNDKRNDWIRS